LANIRKIIPGIPKNFPAAAELRMSADNFPPPPGSGRIIAAAAEKFVG
jgi:hypothetical protein